MLWSKINRFHIAYFQYPHLHSFFAKDVCQSKKDDSGGCMELLGAFFIPPRVDWMRCERDILGIRATHGGYFAEC